MVYYFFTSRRKRWSNWHHVDHDDVVSSPLHDDLDEAEADEWPKVSRRGKTAKHPCPTVDRSFGFRFLASILSTF
jgi:hypothetical protein